MTEIKKIEDFFFAGVIFGFIAGIINHLLALIFKLLVIIQTPWEDTTALFFKPPELFTLPAQIFGFLMSLLTPMLIGVFLCLLVKLTGKDHIYVKSIFLSQVITFTNFAIIFPLVGFKSLQHSITTNYGAFLGMFLFGIVLGYLVKKYTDFKDHKDPENTRT